MANQQKSAIWQSVAALLLFLLAAALALTMFSGPLGVWLGWWDFRTAFGILGAFYPFTGWAALLILLGAVVLCAAALRSRARVGLHILLLPFAGALACGIAWYIPTTFQAPAGESYPPIHDVSTDVVDVPQYVAVLPLRAEAPNSVVYGDSPNMTPERNASLQREAYPDIVPHEYEASVDEMFTRALAAVEEMGWELVDADEEAGRIEATATTFWMRFKDDIVIRIRPSGDGSIVDARSLSRVGGGDAGTNAKRLREFFRIL